VLKGPASSTLYGSGAIGGAVNFTTKEASDFLEEGETRALRFSSTYDSNGDGVKLGIISAMRAGSAEYLAGVNVTTGNDKVDGAGNRLAGSAYDGWSGLLKGKWYLGAEDEQSLTLSLSRTDSDLDGTPVAQTGGATVGAFGLHDLHAVDDTLTLAWRHEVRDSPLLDVTAQLSFTDTSVEKDNFSLGASCAPGTFQVLCDSSYGYATTTLKLENTADLSAGAWENYLAVGVQYSEQERRATSSLGALGFHPEGEDRRIGLYAQGEFTYGERLTIIPGVRVDMAEQTPGAAAVAAGASAQEDTAVSPKIAAMYEVSGSFAIFGSLARTERMPTLDELYSSEAAGALPARTPSLNLLKEEADTVELGFTYQRDGLLAEGDSLQMKVTAFHNDLTNMIATTPRVAGGPAVPYFSNIAAAELWGAEIEAAYDAERWFAQVAYSHVKSKNKATGLTLADTPAENVVVTLGAKLPEQGVTVGWRASYFDKIRTSSATTSGASYDTHDVFLTWSPEAGPLAGLDVNLSVENVFDRAYRNNLSLDNAVGRTAKLSVAKRIAF
jgi:hemoglobin/transferrin/lactoferrin receptor protein